MYVAELKSNPLHCYNLLLFQFQSNLGIYADGPGAYLFHGVVEQQYIFHVMDHALCLSDSKKGLCQKHVTRGGPGKINKGVKSQGRIAVIYVLVVLFYLVL